MKIITKILIKFILLIIFILTISLVFLNYLFLHSITDSVNKEIINNINWKEHSDDIKIIPVSKFPKYNYEIFLPWVITFENNNFDKDDNWNDKYYVYKIHNGKIYIKAIDYNLSFFYTLVKYSFFILLFSVIVTLILWKIFVKYSLKDIFLLSNGIKNINLYKLNKIEVLNKYPDNDEFKQIQKNINFMIEKIEKQKELLKSSIWMIAHEMKTPLMEMLSEINIAKIEWDNKKMYELSKNYIYKLKSIIDTILVIDQIKWWSLEIDYKECNINFILKEIINLYKKDITKKNLSIDIKWKLLLSTDYNLIFIVFKNLIENSIKYSPVGSKIWIILDKNFISIENASEELNKIDIKNIFDKNWKYKSNWNWLWLFLVKEIINILNYKIYVEVVDNIIRFKVEF